MPRQRDEVPVGDAYAAAMRRLVDAQEHFVLLEAQVAVLKRRVFELESDADRSVGDAEVLGEVMSCEAEGSDPESVVRGSE